MPRPSPSLEGQKYGYLKVIERTEGKRKKEAYWFCKCECGNAVIATTTQLRKGIKKSCGCQNKTTAIDLTGKRFGKLIAIERGPNTKYGRTTWKCKCDCGNMIIVTTDNLGKSAKSCGCTRRQKHYVDCFAGTRIRNLKQRKPRMELIRDSGVKGVAWDRSKEKWNAYITFKGKKYNLGYFNEEDLAKAIEARLLAEEKLYEPTIESFEKIKKEQE